MEAVRLPSLETVLPVPMVQADAEVRAALLEHGFDVVTEIDLAATFKMKLGVERPPLKILGACNAEFAYQAVLIDPSASLAIPCNVVLEAVAGATRVTVVDPHDLMTDVDLNELADEVATRLQAVIETMQRVR
jgi:uncharacterized protein (DUF302 family)